MNLNGKPDNRLQQMLDEAFENKHKADVEEFLSWTDDDDFELNEEVQDDQKITRTTQTVTALLCTMNHFYGIKFDRILKAAKFLCDCHCEGKIVEMNCSEFADEIRELENLVYGKNDPIKGFPNNG